MQGPTFTFGQAYADAGSYIFFRASMRRGLVWRLDTSAHPRVPRTHGAYGDGVGTSRGPLTIGYYVGAAVMVAGGLIAWFFGVNAERKSLKDIATPLSAVARALGGTGSAPGKTGLAPAT